MIELFTKDGLAPVTLDQVDAMLMPVSQEDLMETCRQCRYRTYEVLAKKLAGLARETMVSYCDGCPATRPCVGCTPWSRVAIPALAKVAAMEAENG